MRHQTEVENRTVLTLDNGRMVILERTEAERVSNEDLAALARDGKEEGFALFSSSKQNHLGVDDAPGLSLSILVRPGIHAQKAGMLSAIAAVAVARAMEKISELHIRIRWVNDLFADAHQLAAMKIGARITPTGFLDYAVIGISIAIPAVCFKPRLGDILSQVFSGDIQPLEVRLTEQILTEFFLIYDKMMTDNGYIEEYRRRSMCIGRRVRVQLGNSRLRGKVTAIDENAHLVVSVRDGRLLTIDSPTKVSFR